MPVLQPSATKTKVQDIVHSIRAYPEVTPVLGTGGFSQEPALSIANDVMQRFLAQNMDWKFNRAFVNPFLTVALQQDYIGVAPQFGVGTSILDMGWVEQGWRVDINNTGLPQPVFALETVRDLGRTAYQANPFNVSWVPISQAIYGTWQANTAYPSGLGQPFTPTSPYQQFIDVNGNYLFVYQNGTTGSVQPSAPVNSPTGTLVTDGSVIWKVADPNGVAIRLSPLPATSGIVWQIYVVYQKAPPILTSLQNTIAPIPDTFTYLFRQGFLAQCREHANPGSKAAAMSMQKWEEDLMTALRSADREREDAVFFPSTSIMSGSAWSGLPVGPAWPYAFFTGV